MCNMRLSSTLCGPYRLAYISQQVSICVITFEGIRADDDIVTIKRPEEQVATVNPRIAGSVSLLLAH